MQVVCTSTMALGSRALAEQQAIVSRLTSIEALAGMDMLCSDKTGTLTLNITTIESKLAWGQISEQQWLLFAFLATTWTQYAKDAIGTILFKCKNVVQAILDQRYVGCSDVRGFTLLVGFSSLYYVYCDVVAIRSCVFCSQQSILWQSSLSLEVQGFAQTKCLSPSWTVSAYCTTRRPS